MFLYRPLTRLAFVAAAWLLCVLPAPAAVTDGVHDAAGLFKPETVKDANTVIRAVERDYHQDVLVETFAGIPADKKAEYDKVKDDTEKRKHFFAEWARARFKAAVADGVPRLAISILIIKDPGYLQIEVGNVTAKRAFTMDNRDHLEELMLKEFKEKRYDQGLTDGVEYIRTAIRDNLKKAEASQPAPAAPPPTDYPSPTTTAPHPSWLSHGGWLVLLLIGLAVIVGIWVIFAIIRGLSGARRPYGAAGYGGPAYGGGGYGYAPGGGGGFLSGMLGGLFGGAAGGWLYDRFFRGGSPAGGYGGGYGNTPATNPTPDAAPDLPPNTDASGVGGDFGSDAGTPDTGGGDFGGDTGGGDFGGDGGGGDFGGNTDVAGGDNGGGSF